MCIKSVKAVTRLRILVALILSTSLCVAQTPPPRPRSRPFYVIGHNTNTLDAVRRALDAGANAVEPDFTLDSANNLRVIETEGSIPQSTPYADAFLRDVGQIARQRPNLSLIILDSKTADAVQGARLLQYAREGLAGTNVSVILNVAHTGMATFFSDIVTQMRPRECLMIDQDNDPAPVADWFLKNGVTNACYGHDQSSGVGVALDRAVELKLQRCLPKWVYTYTLSDRDQMHDAIRTGVDGIIAADGHVADLVNILQEPEFASQIRLATRADDPFANCSIGYTVSVYTLNRTGAGTDSNITFTLHGLNGTSLQTKITSSKPQRFERGNLNQVSLYGDIGVPMTLTAEIDGNGGAPEWLPDMVHVRKMGDLRIYAAGFGEWIRARQPVTRSLGISRYWLKVSTGTINNGGTDSDIVFTVRGTNGEVQRRVNGARLSMFERGRIDDVYLAGIDVGQVTSLSVLNDGTGDSPRWFLDRINVNKDNDTPAEFVFNRWVEAAKSETVTK